MSERKVRSKLAVIQQMFRDRQRVEGELVALAARRKELVRERRKLDAAIALHAGGKAEAYFRAIEETPTERVSR